MFEHGDSVDMAAEDQFAVINMDSPDQLFAEPNLIQALAETASSIADEWKLVWDFRGIEETIYNDVGQAFRAGEEALKPKGVILASTVNFKMIQDAVGPMESHRVLRMSDKPLKTTRLDLKHVDRGGDAILDEVLEGHALEGAIRGDYDEYAEWMLYQNIESGRYQMEVDDYRADLATYDLQAAYSIGDAWAAGADPLEYSERLGLKAESLASARLRSFLRDVSRTSILNELVIFNHSDRLRVAPFHASGSHDVILDGQRSDELRSLRPARVNHKFYSNFGQAIASLEDLINSKRPSEREIERLLLSNPRFFQSINYDSVYSQVVLPLDDGRSLRPDIIAEPHGSEWSDIIELKLPSEKVLVGRENRAALASAITSVAAQLREYAAYFDNDATAARIENEYGFRCHRPQMVAIVGRDPSRYSPSERRRAMTSYPDLTIITYDQLLRASRQNLLL